MSGYNKRENTNNTVSLWPSFVDVMSNLLILMLFMVVVFMMLNFISGATQSDSKNKEIENLQKTIRQKDHLNSLLVDTIRNTKQELNVAKKEAETTQSDMDELSKTLDFAELESKKKDIKNEQLQDKVSELNQLILQFEGDIIKKDDKINALKNNEENLKSTVNHLTEEMQKLNEVFESTNKYITWQKVQIVELGRKLNRALAGKTAELFKVRSTFFEELSKVIADNKNFVISGDRFVIPSEVFFAKESATIGDAGKAKLKELAKILKEAIAVFPDDVDWILRVDGHTDITPIRPSSHYKSNWELSVARAVSVVNFLVEEGIPANRLAATGFGEFHPIVDGSDADSLARNRRIEFKLTEK